MSIMNYTEPLKYARYTPITCFQFMSQWKQEEEGLTCEICYRGYEEGQLQDTRPRGICYQCWYQHIKTFISQISYKAGSEIISPFEGRDPLDVCLALNTLRSEDAIELEEFLFKKYSSFTGDIEKCPSESCDFVFTMEQCRWGKAEEKCPKCEAVLSQANGLDFKSMIGFVYFLFLTNKCPKCEIPIEKTTGCPHMSCPCGHQFCWYCLKDYYPSPLNVYTVHEPKQCASIFISKIVYTCTCVAGIFLTLLGNEIFQKFMGYFFVGMAYLLHSLLLDIAIAINIFIINNLIVKHYNRLYSNPKSNKWMMGGLVAFDLIVVLLLYYFELLLDSAIILIAEVSIIGVIALIVWMVIITVDTWFNYIC